MNYNNIRESTEPKINGIKDGSNMIDLSPPTQQLLAHWRDRNYIWPPEDFTFRKIAPEDGLALTAELKHKARLIDFMSFAPYLLQAQMIVSQKAVDFLTEKTCYFVNSSLLLFFKKV